jgi:hypothetical protein
MSLMVGINSNHHIFDPKSQPYKTFRGVGDNYQRTHKIENKGNPSSQTVVSL